jgi:hypothetical protein
VAGAIAETASTARSTSCPSECAVHLLVEGHALHTDLATEQNELHQEILGDLGGGPYPACRLPPASAPFDVVVVGQLRDRDVVQAEARVVDGIVGDDLEPDEHRLAGVGGQVKGFLDPGRSLSAAADAGKSRPIAVLTGIGGGRVAVGQ